MYLLNHSCLLQKSVNQVSHKPTSHFKGGPVDVLGVVADEVLEIGEDGDEAVELVGQPEVHEAHVVQRRHEDAELCEEDTHRSTSNMC